MLMSFFLYIIIIIKENECGRQEWENSEKRYRCGLRNGRASRCRRSCKGRFCARSLRKIKPAWGAIGLTEEDSFRFDLEPTIVMMPDINREVFNEPLNHEK